MIRSSSGRRHAFASVFVLFAMGACAPRAEPAGARVPLTTPIERIDSLSALGDLAALAADSMQGRRAGGEGGAMARAYLLQRIRQLGMEAVVQPFRFARAQDTVDAVNLIAHLPGTADGGRAIVVTAHYDHVGVRDGEIFNGADDNASGTAALLSIAAALRDRPPSHDVWLVWLDAEEMGLRGARAFVENPPIPIDSMIVNVNLDMVSRSAVGELYVAGTHHYPSLLPIVERVAERAPVTLIPGHDRPGTGRDDWTSQSDHGVFHQAGVPFLYFGVEDHPDYHRPSDDFERVDRTFYVAAVETVLMALRELDIALR